MLNNVGDESVDLIIADLPYGTTECAWDSVIDIELLWEQYKRIIKQNGAILLFSAQPFTSFLVSSNPQMYKCEWIWEKGNATGFFNAKKQPLRAHESILCFYKKQPTYNPQMSHGHPRKTSKKKGTQSDVYNKNFVTTEYDSTSRYPRSIVFFSSDKQLANYHPTQKPVELLEYLIKTYTNEGDVVVDNTMGSGTAGVACVLNNRKFIGMELEPQFFDTACTRIAAAKSEKRLAA